MFDGCLSLGLPTLCLNFVRFHILCHILIGSDRFPRVPLHLSISKPPVNLCACFYVLCYLWICVYLHRVTDVVHPCFPYRVSCSSYLACAVIRARRIWCCKPTDRRTFTFRNTHTHVHKGTQSDWQRIVDWVPCFPFRGIPSTILLFPILVLFGIFSLINNNLSHTRYHPTEQGWSLFVQSYCDVTDRRLDVGLSPGSNTRDHKHTPDRFVIV